MSSEDELAMIGGSDSDAEASWPGSQQGHQQQASSSSSSSSHFSHSPSQRARKRARLSQDGVMGEEDARSDNDVDDAKHDDHGDMDGHYEQDGFQRRHEDQDDHSSSSSSGGQRRPPPQSVAADLDNDDHVADAGVGMQVVASSEEDDSEDLSDPGGQHYDSGSDSEEDAEDEEASSAGMEVSPEGYAMAGILSFIQLENFRSHKNYRIDFGPNLNIIKGMNGSGKSSVLMGIQFALGARSSVFGSVDSLGQFIRDGANWCQVSVGIKNQGVGAYLPEVFGAEITVQRKIMREKGGSAGYRMLGADGRVQATKLEDIKQMLSHFNVQINNPCVILNQDESKEFLKSDSFEDKYKFFMSGSLLDKLRDALEEISEKRGQMKTRLATLREDLEIKARKVKELEELKQRASRLASLEEQRIGLGERLLWANYAAHQARADQTQFALDAERKEHRLNGRKLEKAGGLHAEAEAQQKEASTQLEQATRRQERTSESLQQAQRQHKDALREAQQQVRRLSEQLERLRRQKRDLEKQAEALLEDQDRDLLQERRELEQRMEAARARLQEQDAGSAQLDRDLEALQEQERELGQAEDALRDAQRQQADLQRRLRQLQAHAQGDELAVFGEAVPAIQQLVDKNRHKFRVPPVGPIGRHLKLDPAHAEQWGSAVELFLGQSLLTGWLVENWEDKQTLQRLIDHAVQSQRQRRAPTVYVRPQPRQGRFQVAHMQIPPVHGARGGPLLRVLDLLQVQSDWVYELLVDMSQAERFVLADSDQSYEICERQRGAQPGQQQLFRGVLEPSGSQVTLVGNAISSNPVGNRAGSGVGAGGRRLLAADPELEIRSVQRSMQQLQLQMQQEAGDRGASQRVRAELQRLRAQQRSVIRERRTVQLELEGLTQEHRGLEERQREAQRRAERNRRGQEDGGEGGGGEEDLQAEEMRRLEHQLAELQESRARAQTAVEQARVEDPELQQLRQDHAEAERAQKELLAATDAALELFKSRQRQVNRYQQRLEEAAQKLQALQTELDQHLAAAEAHREVAADVQPQEIRNPGDPEILRRQIADIDQQMQFERRNRKLRRSAVDINLEYTRVHRELQEGRANLQRALAAYEELRLSHRARAKEWRLFRNKIAERVNDLFGRHLADMNATGRVKFDHAQQTLSWLLEADVRNHGLSQLSSDTRALSGGERSKTTLAFLLAMSDAIDAPFGGLDEFDVFMDETVRKMSLLKLYQSATSRLHRQLFLITPKTISIPPGSKHVKVVEMADPRPQGQQSIQQALGRR